MERAVEETHSVNSSHPPQLFAWPGPSPPTASRRLLTIPVGPQTAIARPDGRPAAWGEPLETAFERTSASIVSSTRAAKLGRPKVILRLGWASGARVDGAEPAAEKREERVM